MGRNVRTLLVVAAVAETVTGLALLVLPSMVVRLLFGAETAGMGSIVSRVAGISLIALGVACWPSGVARQALYAMLIYNLLVALFLVFLGLGGKWIGILLWPAAAAHAVLTILLARVWLNDRKARAAELPN